MGGDPCKPRRAGPGIFPGLVNAAVKSSQGARLEVREPLSHYQWEGLKTDPEDSGAHLGAPRLCDTEHLPVRERPHPRRHRAQNSILWLRFSSCRLLPKELTYPILFTSM